MKISMTSNESENNGVMQYVSNLGESVCGKEKMTKAGSGLPS